MLPKTRSTAGPAVDHELGAVRAAVPAEPYRVRLRSAVRADRNDPDHRIVLQSRAYPLSESGCRIGKNIRRHGGQPNVACPVINQRQRRWPWRMSNRVSAPPPVVAF